MSTPNPIGCDNTYSILNVENDTIMVDDAALTQLQDGGFYFNFTQEVGNYLIVLCDNSTRHFRVTETYDEKFNKEEDARMYIAIVIIIGVLIMGFIVLAIKARDFFKEKLLSTSISMLFFFMALGLAIVGLQIAKEMALAGSLSTDVTTLITTGYKIALWTLYVMVFIVFIIGLYNLFMYGKNTSGLVRKKPSLYDRGTR